jgi:hypothetical protein
LKFRSNEGGSERQVKRKVAYFRNGANNRAYGSKTLFENTNPQFYIFMKQLQPSNLDNHLHIAFRISLDLTS